MLAGVAPIPASSGQVVRCRRNRGRCLTRAVARGLYRLLERQAAPSAA